MSVWDAQMTAHGLGCVNTSGAVKRHIVEEIGEGDVEVWRVGGKWALTEAAEAGQCHQGELMRLWQRNQKDP